METNEVTNQEASHEEFDLDSLRNILEGVLLAAARPLSLEQMQTLLGGETAPDKPTLRRALAALEEDCANRGIELVEVASGFRLQVRQELQPWVSRLWEEKPPRYSRALLETLALIAYRQPITRGEIEDVRGVSVSTNIIRQLEEREWIRVVGHRDVPGKPALFGTTKAFLDYFGLKSLDDLPSLAEIRDIDNLEPELDFSGGFRANQEAPGESESSGEAAEEAGQEAESVDTGSGSAEGGEHTESDQSDDEAGSPGEVTVTDRPDEREGDVSFGDEDSEPALVHGTADGEEEVGAHAGPADEAEADEGESGGAGEETSDDAAETPDEPGEDADEAEPGSYHRDGAASAGRH